MSAFLDRTYQIVPPGQESDYIDIETELNDLLRQAWPALRTAPDPRPTPPWWAGIHFPTGSVKVTTARVPRGPERRSM